MGFGFVDVVGPHGFVKLSLMDLVYHKTVREIVPYTSKGSFCGPPVGLSSLMMLACPLP